MPVVEPDVEAAKVRLAPGRDLGDELLALGSRYAALVGRGAKPTDLRKNCQLNIRVHTPQGFTYAVARADYHGFASLAKGSSRRGEMSPSRQNGSTTPSRRRSRANSPNTKLPAASSCRRAHGR